MLSLIINRNKNLKQIYIVFLKSILNNHIKHIQVIRNSLSIKATSNNLYSVLHFLKSHAQTQFKILVDIICYDRPGHKFRFTVIYSLLSLDNNYRTFVKTKIKEQRPIAPTIVFLFPSAGWLEREVWDLFGVYFLKNSDLRRILTDYGFKGYPLRKDFPLTGFTEVIYDNIQKQVVYRKLDLAQNFRNFKFRSSWKEYKQK